MNLLMLAAIAPLRIHTSDVEPGSASWLWLWIALAVAVTLAGAWAAWRQHAQKQADPHAIAFARLAPKLGLGPRQRAQVRAMAQAAGVPPVALLLSEHAFDHAAMCLADPAQAAELRRTLHAPA
jgi:hypothetical protein